MAITNQNDDGKPAPLPKVPLPFEPNGKSRGRVGRSRWKHLECLC